MVTPLLAFEVAAMLLGLIFGSFLNVCIARLPSSESIAKPRSHCLSCGKPIRWYDNIPVLSWLLLRARCRDCKAPISWQYPLVELATGLWFVVIITRSFSGISAQLSTEQYASIFVTTITLAILGFLLIGLMVMDWQTQLLPDAFTFAGIAIAFFLTCIRAFFLQGSEDQIVLNSTHQLRLRSPGSFASQGNIFLTGPEHLLGVWLISTIGAAFILLSVRWIYQAIRHREGMGLGDVKLLAMIAAFLGFWPAVLALFIGVLLATAYAISLLTRGKAGAATRLAFGSFLAAGGLVSALFSSYLINSYSALLR
jgi:leader peptidase (prepilin peptidase)/N-methyltransferase